MIMKPEELAARLSQVVEAGRVSKGGQQGGRRDELNKAEMQALLAKLKELVPNMPRGKKLSKLEIIQNVIDYILDLQIALETHPRNQQQRVPVTPAFVHRQPLGVLTPSTVRNTPLSGCSTLVESTDKVATDLSSSSNASTRPVSC